MKIYSIKTCKECAQVMKIERPDFVFDTELCTLHIKPEWSEEVVKAIDLLKKNKITAEQYGKVRVSCKV